MEILILGLVLVGLMVYASTRIKKVAAAAFESETVETGEFCIQKPDGFLTVIGGDPKFAFQSYSKEYGEEDAKEFRKATATLMIHRGERLTKIAKDLKTTGNIKSDFSEVINETTYRVIELERTEKDVDFLVLHKIAERHGKVFVFEINMLASADDEFKKKAETMLADFSMK